jgi:cell division protein FtsW
VKRGDRWLLLLALGLSAVGLIMVYSSSAVLGITRYQDPNHFLSRQTIRILLGLVVLVACARLKLRRLEQAAPWLLG